MKTVLLVHAHPEPTSLTHSFVMSAKETLTALGYRVLESDLYRMHWKATFDADDFPERKENARLSFIDESGHAYNTGVQTPDVKEEQEKLLAADAVIFLFPLWWFGMPAILKGWIDRVYAYGFAYGYKGEGNSFRYGDGVLKGKRAMLAVMIGGSEDTYSMRGIHGTIEELLFPVTHGALFYPGMDVLPTHAVYGTGWIDAQQVKEELANWQQRLAGLFEETPIPFRRQNSSNYPDRKTLASHVARGKAGILAQIKD